MPVETQTEPVVHERHIAASPETVFAFFTEADKLTRWLAEEAETDPRPGGANRQTHLSRGERYLMRGEFIEVSPPARVVFTWGFENDDMDTRPGSSTVEVTLEPKGGGTWLTLVHRDLPASERPNHDAGWKDLLAILATAAESE